MFRMIKNWEPGGFVFARGCQILRLSFLLSPYRTFMCSCAESYGAGVVCFLFCGREDENKRRQKNGPTSIFFSFQISLFGHILKF